MGQAGVAAIRAVTRVCCARTLLCAQALGEGNVRLVIDLDFNGLMPQHDQKHLCQQLGYSYSANTKVRVCVGFASV